MQKSLYAATAALTMTCLAAAQATLVVPSGYDNVEGNTANTFPFGYTGTSWAGLRLLQIYDSSHFTNNSINFPILILGIRWRANGGVVDPGGTHNSVTVEMSTAAVDYTAATTNWAANHGNDRTVVYSGPATRLATAGTTPNTWFVDLQFPGTPFLYDPTSGSDLVIDVDKALSWNGNAPSIMHDVVSGTTGVGGPALASRVFGSSLYPSANGTTINHGLVCELTYVPATGLHAGFTSDVQTGPSPLTVHFTDLSLTSDPGGITGWAWDFDNDGTIDSTQQNPTFTYNNCGTYDVSLTVFDATNPPSTKLQTAFIMTDQTSADFTDTLAASYVVLFTDTSTGSPTSWDWDLDGDGVTDSTAQNPAWVYPNANPVTVTLTVSRLCGPTSTISKSVTPGQQITTTFASSYSGNAGWTHFFDMNVTNPLGMEVFAIDVNATNAPASFAIEIYLAADGYSGRQQNPNQWFRVATGSGTSNAVDTPSPVTLNAPFYVPPGLYGVAIHYASGIGPRYTAGNGSNQSYGNGDLALNFGIARSTPQGNPFGPGLTYSPCVWNGTIYYQTPNLSGNAGYGFCGAGCPGSMGRSSLTPNGAPTVGSTLDVTVDNLPMNAAIMLVGFSNTTSPLGPLPLGLAAFGAPGCELRASPDISVFLAGSGNTAVWSLPIPSGPSFVGVQMFQQAVVLDSGFNAAGAVGSDAAGMILGL